MGNTRNATTKTVDQNRDQFDTIINYLNENGHNRYNLISDISVISLNDYNFSKLYWFSCNNSNFRGATSRRTLGKHKVPFHRVFRIANVFSCKGRSLYTLLSVTYRKEGGKHYSRDEHDFSGAIKWS